MASDPSNTTARLEADGMPHELTARLGVIEADLAETIDALTLTPALRDAVRYAALSGGKRLRPLLSWHSCAACGADGDRALPAGSAIELIHAFSLVHDDLPALDDDRLRRGEPTLHVHAGEAMAILAGDAMLAAAFQVIVRRVDDTALAYRLVAELARSTEAMINGQVYDTLGGLPAELSPLERTELIHRNKTGELIRAACRMGAMCAGEGPITAVDAYAEAIGLMFQIVDDLLDVEQSAEHTGKRTGKDAEADKLTYPAVVGVDGARKMVSDLRNEAVGSLGALGPSAEPLRKLAEYLAGRTR